MNSKGKTNTTIEIDLLERVRVAIKKINEGGAELGNVTQHNFVDKAVNNYLKEWETKLD